ncbi:hypothetical protein ACHIPZ_13810 [Antrihabitans sp. NCIMB 15449]|uniref:Portal protein n=1 Tax=Antrihabitans spumae TaxID=3373370 RepID=A0ABW7JML8_9NOCA
MLDSAAPLTEIGYVNGRGTDWQQWDEDERVPELQWPQSVHTFSRMLKEDGRVSSVLQAIGLPIRRTVWRIDPNGASDEVVEFVAENLGLPITGVEVTSRPRSRGRFSWAEHLQTALLMLPYGHSYFEQIYRFDDDGKFRLRKLAPRPQKSIMRIKVALDGGLVSIEQSAPADSGGAGGWGITPHEIGVSRLVAYVRDPEPGIWTGSSLLRPAYKHWILKDELMRVQAVAAKRNGLGMPVGTAASDDPDEVKRMKDLATASRGGMQSGVGLAKDEKFEYKGVTGTVLDMGAAIDYHDKQIALAGLAHFLNLDRGGSYALASVQADTFVQSVQTFAESIADVANSHIVEDLVDINFGKDVPAPRIVFDEIGSRQDATATSLSQLVQAGLLDPDEVVKILVRQSLGIPTQPQPDPESAPTPATEDVAA